MMILIRSYSEGFQISNLWYAPEELLRQKLGNFYKNNPIMSRVIAVPLALITGVVKTILFPIIALVGAVLMPIIALGRYLHGKEDTVPWLQAWTFSVLGVIGTIAFCFVSAYYLPLSAASGIFLTGMAISIVVHVSRAVKAPPIVK